MSSISGDAIVLADHLPFAFSASGYCLPGVQGWTTIFRPEVVALDASVPSLRFSSLIPARRRLSSGCSAGRRTLDRLTLVLTLVKYTRLIQDFLVIHRGKATFML